MNIQAIEDYANAMTEHELAFYREYKPERLAKLQAEQPNAVEDFREKKRHDARELATGIETRSEWFLKRVQSGLLHPDNKTSRKLFEMTTGITLPKTLAATRDVVNSYCGVALSELVNKQNAERDEADRKEREQQAIEETKRLERIAENIRTNRSVSGDEVLDIARHIGIDVHPRTAGSLRKRVVGVVGTSARISGKGTLSDGVWDVIRTVRELLAETTAVQTTDNAVCA